MRGIAVRVLALAALAAMIVVSLPHSHAVDPETRLTPPCAACSQADPAAQLAPVPAELTTRATLPLAALRHAAVQRAPGLPVGPARAPPGLLPVV